MSGTDSLTQYQQSDFRLQRWTKRCMFGQELWGQAGCCWIEIVVHSEPIQRLPGQLSPHLQDEDGDGGPHIQLMRLGA